MKKFYTALFCFLSTTLVAQHYNGVEPNFNPKAAGCTPANGKTFLEFNNVRSLTHTGGNLWHVLGSNTAVYEVPKGSGVQALFASSLWLGGVDVNDQLKLAAVRYRTGNDYWAGPLTDDGTAEIIPEQCVKYDQHFAISRDEVEEFNAWFNAGLYDQQNGTNTQQNDFPNYEIPESILDWPAHGDPSLGQDFYLAPFYDRNKDGVYNPTDGDYPWYDIEKEIDCKTNRTVTLFGDKTLWWVMNDKGNIHTETGGDPLGMEIRSQAFAFATNDEVNNMTFYNYELINRSTQTLYNTYFGVFVDVAMGDPFDDYVGCDVGRGLGYAYNGDAFDGNTQGFMGYGNQPPAIGVDFFEGPYQDNDGIDNQFGIGPGQAVEGNGLGYSDGIIDNERFGMRRFIYYNNLGNGNVNQTDPITATDYYNYLRGIWKDGTKFVYGGTGHISSAGADASIPCDFMFPGASDPQGWGTGGLSLPPWTEVTAGNQPYDRRFAQSAGPFVLEPGAVNNITVGVVYARANSGSPFESVVELRKADDKAQALFDNCFRVMDGPEAPNLLVQELENEVILTLENPTNSNNYREKYVEKDPFLVRPTSVPDSVFDNTYKFQGYQIYQIKDLDVSLSELDNSDLARIVFQCDIRDGVTKLVNYEYDEDLQLSIPSVKVDGKDEGIAKTVSITTDLFATGANRTLINHKKYHYIAVAYAHNNYKDYDPNTTQGYDGQKTPYIRSRKAPVGEIKPVTAIPHTPIPEANGSFIQAQYGDEPMITRLDGTGNGIKNIKISSAQEQEILTGNNTEKTEYQSGRSPITVKVVDPLAVSGDGFEVVFMDTTAQTEVNESTFWYLINLENQDTVYSEQAINIGYEQVIPEYGISIRIENVTYPTYGSGQPKVQPLSAKVIYEDSSNIWLNGLTDNDLYYPSNWILSGTQSEDCQNIDVMLDPCTYNDLQYDEEELFELYLSGLAAPWYLVNHEAPFTPGGSNSVLNGNSTASGFNKINLNSIDLVITNNQENWTRCPVLEMSDESSLAEGKALKFELRKHGSVNKDGNDDGSGTQGMGWFPGYAIDQETGKRLNIAFGENSALPNENGRDMVWNPTSTYSNLTNSPKFGGMHYIYIFSGEGQVPNYDEGQFLYNQFSSGQPGSHIAAFRNCMWVVNPMLEENTTLLSSDVRIELRVEKPYEKDIYTNSNNGWPHYSFSLEGLRPVITHEEVFADSILNQIQVVPNPYFGYSDYETSLIDDRIKITNLTPTCTISIYNMSGKLVRSIKKDNALTSEDWDLKNENGIRIASGVYIIHVDVPNIGEKVLKWYGNMRVLNVENY